MCGIVGRAQLGLLRLFLKADDAAGAIDLHHAEMPGLGRIDQDGGKGDVGARVAVLPQHQVVIHFVDVVAGQDEHVLGLLGPDGVNVLVHRVGGAHVPVFADPLHGRQDLDELAHLAARRCCPSLRECGG